MTRIHMSKRVAGGVRAHGALLLMLGLAMLLGSGCKRQPGTEQLFFPASNEVAGWAKTDDIRTFEAADLWKYIDGEAERYLRAGVRRVSTTDYKFQEQGRRNSRHLYHGECGGLRKDFSNRSQPLMRN